MVQKYWQQTIDGDEVLMGTNGKIYKTELYRIEFVSKNYNLACATLRNLRSLAEAIRVMKEMLRTSEDIKRLGEIKTVRIYKHNYKTLLKEYKQVSRIKL